VAGRRLDAEERALWRKVTAGVRPLKQADASSLADDGARAPLPAPTTPRITPAGKRPPPPVPAPPSVAAARAAANTLDGGWDRRLKRGAVIPDRSVDLHGHTLAGAHAALEAALARAVADDVRVLLVVTGRPPRPGVERRGLIRAAIGDWLAASGHAGRIAAVRVAHPRHGGAGALYLILRRRRED